MWPYRTIAFTALFAAACALSMAYPIVGVVNYMFVYLVNPAKTWWGMPLEQFGVRFSLVAAVFLFMGVVLRRRTIAQVRPGVNAWEVLVIVQVFITLASTYVGLGWSEDTTILVDKYWKMILFVLCLTHLATTRRNFNIVIWTLVLGSLYLGNEAFNAPDWAFIRGRLEWVGGPDFQSTSGLSAHLAAMLPLIGVAFATARQWRWRAVALLAGFLTVNGIALCRTRSSFVGLAAGAVVAVLAAPKSRRLLTIGLLVVVAFAAYALTDAWYWDRMGTLLSSERLASDRAATTRLEIWAASAKMILQYPLGVGVGNFRFSIGDVAESHVLRAAHNSHILCLVELGIPGAIVYLSLLALNVRQLWQCNRIARMTPDPAYIRFMSYGILVSMCIFIVTGMFTDRYYTESYWWILALPTCLLRVARREAERLAATGVHADAVEPLLALAWAAPRLGRPTQLAGLARH